MFKKLLQKGFFFFFWQYVIIFCFILYNLILNGKAKGVESLMTQLKIEIMNN